MQFNKYFLVRIVIAVLSVGLIIGVFAYFRPKDVPKVLVFSKTAGFRHSSIPNGIAAIRKLGQEHNFQVDTTENAARFVEENLKQYAAVVFLNTTGDVLNAAQQADFERYIQAGGGYVGIHAATDTEYGWPWYNKLAGAYFNGHPSNPNVQQGTAHVVNRKHPSTKGLPKKWVRADEFYNFKNFNPAVNVLVKVDEKTYKEGTMGDNHPMSWYHAYDGGRAFYTNFGHTEATFTEDLFLKHLWGGLFYAMGGEDMKALDYSKARSERTPEENRFTRVVLDEKLAEPTELAVMDDGRILFAQRKGELKLYDPSQQATKVINQIDVYAEFEYGLMGLALDPNFKQNKWVYLYYTPADSVDSAQRLSRFKFDETAGALNTATEQIILRVPVKRTDCCHTGGSIAFDKAGNLYLSTGDDTNPFASNGYAPIDNRPGRQGWNALLTSSNTNDLRGKIIRIKVNEDGTYSIPQDNLFPQGTEKARPEIYVMGNRNPYRIAIDQRTGYLYWGEVGPDAGEDNEKRGPRGYDEVNQARKAGYFGWPLFIGDNKPYHAFNFADSTSGPLFDPMKPVNNATFNTGLTQLPAAQKAFIWYPYVKSPEFPLVGIGSRNAMAGPVYYADDYEHSNVKFPAYYNGKFFAYDWMRGWIMAITMNEAGDFVSMEPFMPQTKLNHPIDMQFGRDGALYLLEYGSNWFAQNDDARLSRIEFNPGNRKPVAVLTADKTVGAAPLTVNFSSKGSIDYDEEAITYEWVFTGDKVQSTDPNPTFTFSQPGVYKPTLKVKDTAGNTTITRVEVKVGNEVPKVEIALAGNKSFYWSGEKVPYEVMVRDKEDGMLSKGIQPEEVKVRMDYMKGFDRALLVQGHQMNTSLTSGARLIELSDCKACHSIDKKSIGPAYRDVAQKYKGLGQMVGRLADKIIQGGGGVWGEQAMSAHPQLSKADASEMVTYILSLADDKKANSLPLKGAYLTQDDDKANKQGTYILTASYTDRGANEIVPMTGQETIVLRHPQIKAVTFDDQKDIVKFELATGNEIASATTSGSYVAFKNIDLTGINSLVFSTFAPAEQTAGGTIEVRLDSPTGKMIGSTKIKAGTTSPVSAPIETTTGMHNLYFVFINENAQDKPLLKLDWIQFSKNGL